ncbi:hypothetical protein TcCL_ESM05972 [Trypanosoma cruzi]|nr:hypothetical protein TcCL_ESM05972 [Trypanosoma cruzi]
MHQPFLRVGDTNSVAEAIWMGVHRGKIRAFFRVYVDGMQLFALPVMPRVCHDTTLRRARGAIVRAISLDATALFGCVIRLCGGSVKGEDVDGPSLPDRCASFC